MRKSLRLAWAAATAATVLATGVAVTVAFPASATSTRTALDISGNVTLTDAFIPPAGSDKIGFAVTVVNAYDASGKPVTVKAQYKKQGELDSDAWHDADVTSLPGRSDAPSPNEATVKGTLAVSSSDKPGKDWKIRFSVTNPGASPAADYGTPLTLPEIAPATRVTGARVTPNPVYLKPGKEIDVFADFTLEKYGDENITDVRLESKNGDDYYSLGSGLEEDGKTYHDSTAFDYNTTSGAWQLRISVDRGTKKYRFVKGFDVKKSIVKAKSKISLYASPYRVKAGKTVKLFGKVYRGSKPWSKKIVKLYFKRKGTTKWRFVGYIGATSLGKYAKLVKPKYDGYWRTTATGTRYTYGSLSVIRFVDVR